MASLARTAGQSPASLGALPCCSPEQLRRVASPRAAHEAFGVSALLPARAVVRLSGPGPPRGLVGGPPRGFVSLMTADVTDPFVCLLAISGSPLRKHLSKSGLFLNRLSSYSCSWPLSTVGLGMLTPYTVKYSVIYYILRIK